MDDAARNTLIAAPANPNPEINHGLLNRFSREVAAATGAKKSVRISTPGADKDVASPKRGTSSAGRIQPVDNGLLKRVSRISPKAIDAVVRKASTSTQLSERKISTSVLAQAAKEKKKSSGAANPMIESKAERLNSKRPSDATSNNDTVVPKESSASASVNSSPEVQPLGDHVLLKRLTANAKVIDPAGVIAARTSSYLAQPVVDHRQLKGLSAKAIHAAVESAPGRKESSSSDSARSSSIAQPAAVVETQQGLMKKLSAKAIDAAVRFTPSESSSAAEPVVDHGLLKEFSVRAIDAAIRSEAPSESSAKTTRSSSSSSFVQQVDEADHRLLRKFSPEAVDAAVRFNPSSGVKSSSSSSALAQPVVEVVHGRLKKFSPEVIDAAMRFTPSSEQKVDAADLKTESESAETLPPLPSRAKTLSSRTSNGSIREVKVDPPKLFGPRAKAGGVLDINEPKAVRISVLGVRGRVLYLEVYKGFVDLLLNFLIMRTGAVIKLLHEVDTGLEFGGGGGGILNVYDSVSKLNESMLTVDKDLLLDPIHKLILTKELQSLDSFQPECCNADCPKYLSCSRVICKDCTISNHFSCSICNAYFRDNVHTTMCYAPWRPWGTHVSAAPVLHRYTVVESSGAIMPPKSKKPRPRGARCGFVRNGVPFMVTNDLNISPLTTRSIAKVLKALDDQDGKTEELDCHDLLIGKTEVLFLLGAAMTSLTPLTDVFAPMCKSENRISVTQSLSRSPTLSQELPKRASSLSKPIGDFMAYVRPLASGLVNALQQGTEAAVKRFSESQEGGLKPETSKVAIDDYSPQAGTKKILSSLANPQVLNPEGSPPAARKKKSSLLATSQDLIPEVSPPTATRKKSYSVATTQDLTSETMKAAEDNPPPSPAIAKNLLSVAKPRGSVSKTDQAVDPLLLLPGGQSGEASAQAASATPEEIQQKHFHEGLRGDQPSAELTVSRKSSGIVQQKSIFLPPEATSETDEEPSPASTPRRGFFNKFFSSRVVKAPMEKKKKKKKEVEPDSTPSATPSSTNPPTVEPMPESPPDGKKNELSLPTGVQSLAENDQLQPAYPDPTSTPDPAPTPKKRRGWFKLLSPKSAKPHPDTTQVPTPPSLPQEESSEPPQPPPAEYGVRQEAPSPPLPTEKSELPALPEGDHEEEEVEHEDETQARATTLPPAIAPTESPPEEISPYDSVPGHDGEFGPTNVDNSSLYVSNAEIMEEFPFELAASESEFPTAGFA